MIGRLWNSICKYLVGYISLPGLLFLPVLSAFGANSLPVAYVAPSDKGGFQYSDPTPFAEVHLDLSPIERQVAAQASTYCGTALAAAPLDLGDADSFMGNMAGKAASAAVGKLLGGLLGGGGKSKKPDLYKDPVKNKYKQKIDHVSGDARLRIG